MIAQRWWTGLCRCAICQHEVAIVIPIAVDATAPSVAIECSACRNFTMHPIEGYRLDL